MTLAQAAMMVLGSALAGCIDPLAFDGGWPPEPEPTPVVVYRQISCSDCRAHHHHEPRASAHGKHHDSGKSHKRSER
jgi:hypothetical protein